MSPGELGLVNPGPTGRVYVDITSHRVDRDADRARARRTMDRATTTTATTTNDRADGYVVIRATGLTTDGRARATVESEAMETLERAIEASARLERARARSGGKGGKGKRTRPACEFPVETTVWHVDRREDGGAPRAEDGEFMVTLLSSVRRYMTQPPLKRAREHGHGAPPTSKDGRASTELRSGHDAVHAQIAPGVPFVEAKIFGQTADDPFMIRPNISNETLRTLLGRAVGKYLAEEREPYPVLPKQDAQIQIAHGAHGMACHVLAIRALGHSSADFSMSLDEQGCLYVRCEPAEIRPADPASKVGRPFEMVCQFPTLVDLLTCRCVYQNEVLYVIAYPRSPKSRALRLSAPVMAQDIIGDKPEENGAPGTSAHAISGPSSDGGQKNERPIELPSTSPVRAPEARADATGDRGVVGTNRSGDDVDDELEPNELETN